MFQSVVVRSSIASLFAVSGLLVMSNSQAQTQNSAPIAAADSAVQQPAAAAATGSPVADAPVEDQTAGRFERPSGFEFSIGTGGSFAMGKLTEGGANISDITPGAVVGTLGGGYRFLDHAYVGVYLEGGLGIVNSSKLTFCQDDEVTCSTALVKYGVQARFMFNPQSRYAWWVSAGLGKEALMFASEIKETGDIPMTLTASGTEAQLRLGMNIQFEPGKSADVYLGYANGSYDRIKIRLGGDSAEAAGSANHGFIDLGVAYTF